MGSSGNPIPSSISAGLPAFTNSHLALSGPPAKSTKLGLSAKMMDAIKKSEFVDFDLILSECFIVQNPAGMGAADEGEHQFSLADHQHQFSLADHQHQFSLADHQHQFSLADHQHQFSLTQMSMLQDLIWLRHQRPP